MPIRKKLPLPVPHSGRARMPKCAKCGGEKFAIPKNPKAHDLITCGKCGAIRSYYRLQKQVLATAKKTVEEELSKRTGKMPIVIKIR